jgi:hypothetical protein
MRRDHPPGRPVTPVRVRHSIVDRQPLTEHGLRFVGKVADEGERSELLHGYILHGDAAAEPRGQRTQSVEELLPGQDLALFGGHHARGVHDAFPDGLVARRDRVHERLLGRLEPLHGLRRGRAGIQRCQRRPQQEDIHSAPPSAMLVSTLVSGDRFKTACDASCDAPPRASRSCRRPEISRRAT